LGTHCFDLMRYFAGDPLWVFAHVTDAAREVSAGSGRSPGEPVGMVAGDEVAAMFAFPGGIHGYFGSKANDVITGSRFGVTLYGSRGALYMPIGGVPEEGAMILRSTNWAREAKAASWEIVQPVKPKERHEANLLMARDLLDAIAKDREPVCSARDGRWAVEMVTGIYQSQIAGARVAFPLRDRRNPL
jgi:predicted dehydrogenase